MSPRGSITSVPVPRVEGPGRYLASLPVRVRLLKAAGLVARYEEARGVAALSRNEAAFELSGLGFTYAEIGELLGVSGARVKQYVRSVERAMAGESGEPGNQGDMGSGGTLGSGLDMLVENGDVGGLVSLGMRLAGEWDVESYRVSVEEGLGELFGVVLRAREGLFDRDHVLTGSPGEQFVGLLDGVCLVNALVLGCGVSAEDARALADRFFSRVGESFVAANTAGMYVGVGRVCEGLARACEIGAVEPE